MTAAAITADEARLDVGWVVGATLRVLRTRAVDLLLIALPFLWLPSLIAGFAPGSRPLQLLMNLPALVFYGGGSLITYQELTGGLRVTASDATRQGAARFGTLWLVGLISGLLTVLGLLLLIVPGVIAGVGFCTASTAVMAENKNSVPALERAWNLSRGQRWRLTGLAGLLLVASLAVLLVGVITGAVLGVAGAGSAIDPVADLGFGPIAETLIAAVTTVGTAAAYVGLRTAKEGPAEDIARTFD
jgi:hypothetical protein